MNKKSMLDVNRIATKRTNVQTRGLVHEFAKALIMYADTSPAFRDTLYHRITELPTTDTTHLEHTHESVSPWLIPGSDRGAEKRMEWVLGEILWQRDAHADTLDLLAQWAREHDKPAPKNLVIGIIGLAIWGPTLGIKTTSHYEAMYIVVRDDITRVSRKTFVDIIQKTSTGFVASEVWHASGNAYRLEPTLADWFYGERTLRLESAPAAELARIQDELTQHKLPHAVHEDENGISALAISPAVNGHFFLQFELSELE